MTNSTLTHWFHGIRVYIALAIGLVSIETIWWALAAYGHTNLAAIRIEETFAWLAVGLLALALLIGPAYKVWPNLPAKFMMRDARRLFGVGAAWFSLLHIGIAYGALFKAANPFSLPTNYQRAFLWGAIAALILIAMAATSFDGAMRAMGKNWFRVHRLVYVAAVLVLLHAFMIGTHASSTLPLILLTAVSCLILGLQIWAAFVKHAVTNWQIVTISLTGWFLLLVLIYGFSQHS